MPKVIELKTWPEFYEAITHPDPLKRKTLEIRKEDGITFEVRDVLVLNEYNPEKEEYTGKSTSRIVTHCLRGHPWVPEGYVAMSICIL